MKFSEIRKTRDYKHAMYTICNERYGIESIFFNPRNPHRIGLEDIEDELEANEEENDGRPFADDMSETGDMGGEMGPDMEDVPMDPNADLDNYNI